MHYSQVEFKAKMLTILIRHCLHSNAGIVFFPDVKRNFTN